MHSYILIVAMIISAHFKSYLISVLVPQTITLGIISSIVIKLRALSSLMYAYLMKNALLATIKATRIAIDVL